MIFHENVLKHYFNAYIIISLFWPKNNIGLTCMNTFQNGKKSHCDQSETLHYCGTNGFP